jgi:hypothetical protein
VSLLACAGTLEGHSFLNPIFAFSETTYSKMSLEQRKAEIQAKRAKLQELRAARVQREQSQASRKSGIHTPLSEVGI